MKALIIVALLLGQAEAGLCATNPPCRPSWNVGQTWKVIVEATNRVIWNPQRREPGPPFLLYRTLFEMRVEDKKTFGGEDCYQVRVESTASAVGPTNPLTKIDRRMVRWNYYRLYLRCEDGSLKGFEPIYGPDGSVGESRIFSKGAVFISDSWTGSLPFAFPFFNHQEGEFGPVKKTRRDITANITREYVEMGQASQTGKVTQKSAKGQKRSTLAITLNAPQSLSPRIIEEISLIWLGGMPWWSEAVFIKKDGNIVSRAKLIEVDGKNVELDAEK
ncbi:MAG: hypothetical protein HZA89_08575 [Verrucomicrobia bacterium]|nr:hypothetical protein [Verrucomicrobiota bacterium]